MKTEISQLVAAGVDVNAATAVICIADAITQTVEREVDELLAAGREPAYVKQYLQCRREQLVEWVEGQLPIIINRVAEIITDLNRPDDVKRDVEAMIG